MIDTRLSENDPYGYVVELWGPSGYLIHISRCQPRLSVAEACANNWAKSYGEKWKTNIVALVRQIS